MKFYQVLIVAAVFLTSCSSPKYAYHFDHYDYQSGKKMNEETRSVAAEHSPLVVDQHTIVANSASQPVVSEIKNLSSAPEKATLSPDAQNIAEKFKEMSKDERKTFRKALKKQVLSYAKKARKNEGTESVNAIKEFDTLSGLAIVFGVGGIVMIMLAGVSNIFWVLGAISLVIGAFFFVKWVANGNG
ncbi:hypothetical protein [Chryseolinea sp. H1M3-3]|uniref:hypothetical protein n=1 Tax=Chryseolinea sp. H1M3-3 TaxID=3034144 RepID=UPI0023EDBC31|nr:hypothetical protein [Chryseolinea sp. H1M3-3]